MKMVVRAIVFLSCTLPAFTQTKITPKPSTKTPVATSPVASKEQPKTLGAFKQRFLNQDVIVNDVPFEDKYCLQWTTAQKNPDGTYEELKDIYNHLPLEYRGQTATVVAIQLAPSFLQRAQVGGTNAFGEKVSEDDIDNPYMEVAIGFKDGTFAMTRGYTITLPEVMELASKRHSIQEKLDSMLPTVVGQPLYFVGFSRLYKPTATMDEMMGSSDILSRLSILDIPFLQPLTITKAKYLPDTNAVVMKVKLPNGSEAIALTMLRDVDFADPKTGFLAKISGSLLAAVPKDLTPKEIDAIKGMKLFRGMSKDALEYSVGFAEKENDWGRGGKQFVYFDGKLLVYLDASGKVQDWQNFQ